MLHIDGARHRKQYNQRDDDKAGANRWKRTRTPNQVGTTIGPYVT